MGPEQQLRDFVQKIWSRILIWGGTFDAEAANVKLDHPYNRFEGFYLSEFQLKIQLDSNVTRPNGNCLL